MEKALVLLIGGMMALASCNVNVNGIGHKIEPSDNIVKNEYKLDAFTEVSNHVVANIKLIQNESKDGLVVLSAPDNYVDLFDFESEDGQLDINFTKDNINIDSKHVNITVYTSDLLKIKNSGAASIEMNSLDTDNLEVENSGVGSFNMSNVLADNIDVKCSGVGSISINGETLAADLLCSGVGSINAQNLKAKNVEAKVTGVGSITCHASESINGKVTGVGSLKYAGHPQKKNLNKPVTGGISEI